MKFFITTFRREDNEPVINKITGYYDLKSLFNAMEVLHQDKILFCVYEAECVLDFS